MQQDPLERETMGNLVAHLVEQLDGRYDGWAAISETEQDRNL
jgi:hypothetical protein